MRRVKNRFADPITRIPRTPVALGSGALIDTFLDCGGGKACSVDGRVAWDIEIDGRVGELLHFIYTLSTLNYTYAFTARGTDSNEWVAR